MTDISQRPLRPALLLGLAGRCPSCGDARLFARFLKPVDACPKCGEPWQHHQADDFPPYLVILIVGHILIPVMVEVNALFDIPTPVQAVLWPAAALILALSLLQPVKGAVIAFQWAKRMHGFGPA